MQTVQSITWRFVLLPGVLSASWPAAALKINGSTTVNLPVAEAAEVLRAERGMQIEGEVETFVDFMLSERGQALLRKHGFLRLSVGQRKSNWRRFSAMKSRKTRTFAERSRAWG
jgi:hypothetical protein